MKRFVLALIAVLVGASLVAAAAVADRGKDRGGKAEGPERIALPDGFRPEGIAAGKSKDVYVGSIPTGQVLEVNTRTGQSEEAVPAREGHAAIGLKYDKRSDRLFVAGGPTGKAFVYDEDDGAELAALQLTPTGQETFVNDVVLTRKKAFFTDSRQPVIYSVKRRGLGAPKAIQLPGFPMTEGNNLNGIEAVDGGRRLLAVQTSTGTLWRINPRNGAHRAVNLGPNVSLENGDGLLMVGKRTLLVVQNRSNQIAVVRLGKRYRSGRIVRTIKSTGFDVPTTVARQGKSLFLPNARFTTPPTPETDYWVTRVSKR